MSEMEEKLSTILGNPQLMQQIMGLAQSMGQPQPPKEPETPDMPLPDPRLLQALSSLMGQGQMDGNQKQLLRALDPYISHRRLQKLEKAMKAAKLAKAASGFLNAGGLQLLQGGAGDV